LTTLLSQDWSGPTLLMGDFNEWHPFSSTIRALDRLLGRSAPRRSFPSSLPLLPLDRIWIRPADALLSVYAWHSPQARVASDHLPVVAELRID
jgi:endonuclease/exonuclease/phosphatase family metal-dependent hydrolase